MSEPQKYTKKPVTIEAMQWDGTRISANEIVRWIITSGFDVEWWDLSAVKLYICTLESNMNVSPGDFVIRGIQGWFYSCKSDIFTETHEKTVVRHE